MLCLPAPVCLEIYTSLDTGDAPGSLPAVRNVQSHGRRKALPSELLFSSDGDTDWSLGLR